MFLMDQGNYTVFFKSVKIMIKKMILPSLFKQNLIMDRYKQMMPLSSMKMGAITEVDLLDLFYMEKVNCVKMMA